MIIDIAVILIAVAVIIQAAFIIPAIIEIRKTSAAIREFFLDLGSELKPALHELQSTLTETKGLVAELSARTEEVKTLTTALGETGRNLTLINGVLGSAAGLLTTTSIWATGAKAAGKMILERLVKQRKGEG